MTKLLVVSDSCSLILATKANLLGVICEEFTIKIPKAVFEETITAGKKFQKADAYKIDEAIQKGQILVKQVQPLKQKGIKNLIKEFSLGDGEEEAIWLYLQTNANLLLVDDKQAINTAQILEINWATIPNIVVSFAKRKKITKNHALKALEILQEEGRYKLNIIFDSFKKIEEI